MNNFFKYKKYFGILLLIGFIVYLPILNNGFVWDDIGFIIDNPEVHQLNLFSLLGHNMFNSALFYRPIPAVYFASLYTLFGQQAFFYHIVQLALHLVGTYLLYILFRLFFSEIISLFLVLVFLIHPINVESVAYIGAGTPNELFFLSGISALLLATEKQVSGKKLTVIISLLFLSVLSKEIGALFIILIIAYRYIFKKCMLKVFTLSGIGLGVAYIFIRMFIGGTIYSEASDYVPIAALPLWQRLLHAPAILLFYLKTFFYPVYLDVEQQWTITTLNLQNFLIPLFVSVAFLILLLTVLYMLYKNDSELPVQEKKHTNYNKGQPILEQKKSLQFAFFFLWFVTGMLPILQIIPLDETVAERFFYFPIVGLLGMIGFGIQSLLYSYPRHLKIYYTVAIILLSLFFLRTFVRTFDWKDDLTLFGHDAKEQPNNYKLTNQYANALIYATNYDEALKWENLSIAQFQTIDNLGDLGAIYQSQQQYVKAIKVYRQALVLFKTSTSHSARDLARAESIYSDLPTALLSNKQPDEAIRFIRDQALKQFPDDVTFYVLLASAESSIGHYQQAHEAAQKAYQLDPNDAQTKAFYDMILKNQTVQFK